MPNKVPLDLTEDEIQRRRDEIQAIWSDAFREQCRRDNQAYDANRDSASEPYPVPVVSERELRARYFAPQLQAPAVRTDAHQLQQELFCRLRIPKPILEPDQALNPYAGLCGFHPATSARPAVLDKLSQRVWMVRLWNLVMKRKRRCLDKSS